MQVWVDTGGTFTDGVALAADGSLRKVKVLSSSALRGTVVRACSPTEYEIEESWSAPPRFVRGFTLRRLDRPERETQVTGYDAGRRRLTLAGRPDFSLEAGTPFEVLSPEEAPVLAARLLTGTPPGQPVPAGVMRLATTLGTNALLERRGVPTALFVTRGFGDLIEIGTQQRPDLFALEIRKPPPLHARVIEVDERLSSTGEVLRPLNERELSAAAERLHDEGIRVAAVALMHAYRNPRHEARVREILQDRGFSHVSCSAELAPSIKLLQRSWTAVTDAYLSPVVRSYLERVGAGLPDARLHVMTSAGGLVSDREFRAKDSLLSGPAGGVVGAAQAGRRSGFDRLLAFDMGGTSTDVARIGRDYEYRFEHGVGAARLMAPALAIESVAAGGGSICRFDGHRLRVGPESAGAHPGPACYGAGGPLTMTDVNLLLGRLDPSRFGIPIVPAVARERLAALSAEVESATGDETDGDALLEGLLAIADETMADAIRRVSLRRGYDPAVHVLVAFGGAGGQHACGVAERLGVRTVLSPADAGLLSALGLGHAVLERFAERQILRPLDEVLPEIGGVLAELEAEASDAVAREGVLLEDVEVRRRIAHLRYVGQDASLEVELAGDPTDLRRHFEEAYLERFGHRPAGRGVELVTLRAIASTRPADETGDRSGDGDLASRPGASSLAAAGLGAGSAARRDAGDGGATGTGADVRTTRARFRGRWRQVPVFDRSDLAAGTTLAGPCLVFDPHGATVVAPAWRAELDRHGALVLRRDETDRRDDSPGIRPADREGTPASSDARGPGAVPAAGADSGDDPTATGGSEQPEAVRLELFTHRFTAIAREMGERLRRTAISTNVKERMDFSCALLDAGGELVVNAPHIPVHLGAVGLCVREVARAIEMRPGDVVVTNHPAYGGSHLPDVTVVTPVHVADETEDDAAPSLLGYVASRAHHAEIGGARPGSMPPAATRLAEEGVVVPPMLLIRDGHADWERIRRRLIEAPHPTRALADNLADLRAAVAANRAGARALQALAASHGAGVVAGYMARLKRVADERLRAALRRIPDGRYEATGLLDDGSPLAVTVVIEGERATIDFGGSGAVHPGNLNATPAIVRSAVIYVLRLLLREPLPLNEGLMRAVTLRIPEGILAPRFPPDPGAAPAVVGGNVETSQRLVDTLLQALGLAACSQGTMNNLIFGNERFGYYETLGGGTGAGPDFDGADAVHSHMTNTAITDPELLEHRYPVRVDRFAVRRGSGGDGRQRGGDGIVRELTFLEPLALSVLTQHRTVAPYGAEGGAPGRCGSQRVVGRGGEVRELGSVDGCDVEAGDRLIVETPGGGGWGRRQPWKS